MGDNEPVSIADEVPFEIPESWEWVRLESLVYNHGQKKPEDTFSYIDIGSIDNANQELSSEENIIDSDKAPSRARKIVKKGDIIYSTVRPYLHNMCIIDHDFTNEPIASTGFAVMTCHTDYLNKFLFLYMMSPDFDSYANSTDNAKGVAYPAINDNKLYKALIPVPPVSEQKRIIEKYSSVKPYVQKYDSVYIKLLSLNTVFPERLKKSILQEAVMGKLVPQDENDEPASVLLERIREEKQLLIAEGKLKKDKHESIIYRRDNSHYEKLDGVERCIDDEIPFEIPESWCWCRLGDVGETNIGLTYKPSDKTNENGVLVLRSSNIQDGLMNYNDCIYVSCDIPERARIHTGDILICARNGSRSLVGKCAIVDKEGMTFGAFMAKFQSRFNPYIKIFLDSPLFRAQLERVKTETINQITQNMLKKQLIPLPPINEQYRIIKEINKLTPYLSKYQ